ncbi:hypothetical protein HUU05_03995, partial [candidate division KSB1 bacterium]|nr:hypothetical protein [candidate division KSB1 bacterium]
AAKYAGMNIIRNFVLVMALAGGLAGLAGTAQVLGVDRWVGQGFSAGYGFDAIALALLGRKMGELRERHIVKEGWQRLNMASKFEK